MTDQLSEAHSDAQIIWECIYDHGNGKFRGMKSSLQRADARLALGRLSAKATEAIRLLQEFDKAMAVAGDWAKTDDELERLKLLVDRVRFFLEPPAPPQSAEGAEHMTTPQPAALPEHCAAIEQLKMAAANFENAASVPNVPNAGDYAQKAREIRASIAALQAQPAAKCDGNHGGPRCADPECWNDDPPAQPAAVSDAEIDAALEAWFEGASVDGATFKTRMRDAVGAILALRPQAVPMTAADAVQVYGIKNGQQTLLGTAPMPSRMKARELAREQFGHFEDGDGSDAELCFYALEQLIEHMERSAHHGITAQGGEG